MAWLASGDTVVAFQHSEGGVVCGELAEEAVHLLCKADVTGKTVPRG
jgi:hypothetical protein